MSVTQNTKDWIDIGLNEIDFIELIELEAKSKKYKMSPEMMEVFTDQCEEVWNLFNKNDGNKNLQLGIYYIKLYQIFILK